MSNIKANLSYLMRMKGINPTALAMETQIPQPTIFRILSGDSLDPRTTTLKPIANYFGITVEHLREGDVRNNSESCGLRQEVSALPHPIGSRLQVLGTASIDGEVFLHDGDMPTDSIDYPSINPSSYAILVRGNALRPRARPGEFLIIDSSRKGTPGDDVLLHLLNGTRFVRTLLYVRNDEITVATLRHHEAPESIPLSEVLDTQCVIGIINYNA